MRKILLMAAAVALSMGSAAAADLPARPAYKAPAVVPSPGWTGFYLGGNVGYGWTDSSGDIAFGGATGPITAHSDGVLGGFQAGYNWQTGPFVFGVEADIQASGAKGNVTATAGGVTLNATGKEPWFATFRGRLGYDINRTMLYVTGGGLYGEGKLDGTLSTTGAFSSTADFWTYVVGAGVETMFLPNWSAKLEYLYAGTPTTVPVPPGTSSLTGSSDGNIVRAGINYHF